MRISLTAPMTMKAENAKGGVSMEGTLLEVAYGEPANGVTKMEMQVRDLRGTIIDRTMEPAKEPAKEPLPADLIRGWRGAKGFGLCTIHEKNVCDVCGKVMHPPTRIPGGSVLAQQVVRWNAYTAPVGGTQRFAHPKCLHAIGERCAQRMITLIPVGLSYHSEDLVASQALKDQEDHVRQLVASGRTKEDAWKKVVAMEIEKTAAWKKRVILEEEPPYFPEVGHRIRVPRSGVLVTGIVTEVDNRYGRLTCTITEGSGAGQVMTRVVYDHAVNADSCVRYALPYGVRR